MDKWLRNVNVVRVVALMVGVLLWFIVHMDETVNDNSGTAQSQITENTIYNVTVKTTGLDTQRYAIVSMDPTQVDITVRGKPEQLLEVNTKTGQSRIEADLSNVTLGENQILLKAISFPSGVTVEKIEPAQVNVIVEEVVQKEVPVRVDVTGQPSPGYEAGEPLVNPGEVYVSAPQSVMDQIVEARAVIDLAEAEETVSVEVKLEAVNDAGEVVKATIVPTSATVEVPITLPFKEVPLEILMQGDPPPGYSVASITPSVDTVTVYGSRDVVESLEAYGGLELNLQSLTESQIYTMELPLYEGVEFVRPSSVEVTVEIVASNTRIFEGIPIQLSGENEAYEWSVQQPEDGLVDVTVEGAPDILNALEDADVQVIVDVSDLPPGEHDLPVSVEVPTYVKVAELSYEEVTVKITEVTEETDGLPDDPLEDDDAGDEIVDAASSESETSDAEDAAGGDTSERESTEAEDAAGGDTSERESTEAEDAAGGDTSERESTEVEDAASGDTSDTVTIFVNV